MVLYRKYRPQSLKDVIGQDHVRVPILASLQSGKISHAYLFTGPRGTGKTSVARIIAKSLNCQSYLEVKKKGQPKFGEPCNQCESCQMINAGTHFDLLEIDAASNRGIDEIRDLREKIKLSPAHGGYKVYIVDEAHMLTPEAFNALLKTLEEPPEHAIFILATTEPQKIPVTVSSRTNRFDFKIPNVDQIKQKLAKIAQLEGWKIPPEVLEEIAKQAGGAFRDAEVLLEKVASVDQAADLASAREILGKKTVTAVVSFLHLLQQANTQKAILWLDDYVKAGGSPRVLLEGILDTLRKAILLKAGAGRVIGPLTEEELQSLSSLAHAASRERLLSLIDAFNKATEQLRDAYIAQLPIELAIIETTFSDRALQEDTADVPQEMIEQAPIGGVEVTQDQEPKTDEETTTPQKQARLLQKIKKGWPKVLKALKPENASLEIFLRQSEPGDLDEDLLTIEFAYSFHKEKVEERKYRELVEKVLERFFGTPLRIKGIVNPLLTDSRQPEAKSPLKKEGVDPVEVFGNLD